ncbi:hypothetical protein [Candidatus Phytoplasma oryzae]|nr:YD repeat-containing protein [Candidatus Phytoplasma oryzae]
MNLTKIKKNKNKIFKIEIFKILTLIFIFFCILQKSKIYGNQNSSLKVFRYINDNNIKPEIEYEYQKLKNNQFRIISKKYYYPILNNNDSFYKIHKYIYDNDEENCKIIKKIETTKNSSCSYTFEYNSQNQLIGIKNPQNQFQVKYTYDEQNRLKSKKIFYFNDRLIENKYFSKEKYYFQYNNQGQKINKIYYSHTKPIIKFPFFNFYCFKKRKKINKIITENQYDKKGNKIKKIKKNKMYITYEKKQNNSTSIVQDIYTYSYLY